MVLVIITAVIALIIIFLHKESERKKQRKALWDKLQEDIRISSAIFNGQSEPNDNLRFSKKNKKGQD